VQQLLLVREASPRLSGEERLTLFFLDAERRDLRLDRAEQLPPPGEERADPGALARALQHRALTTLLGRLQAADGRGVAVPYLGRPDGEAMIGQGDGVSRVECVDHLAEAVAAEEDRQGRR
jgi:hypothetical protein